MNKGFEARLRGRKSDSEEAMSRRLQTALEEMEYVAKYTYVVTNDTVEDTVTPAPLGTDYVLHPRDRFLNGATWKELISLEGKGV